MTTAQKLKAIAEMIEEHEGNRDFYTRESKDESNSESMREYYAYRADLYKYICDTLLAKVTKL